MKNARAISLFIVLLLLLAGPLAASAQVDPPRYLCPQVQDGWQFEDGLGIPDFGVWDPNEPLSIFIWMFYAAMGLTAALAVTMLVVAGIRYIGSAGNASQQGRAKQMIWNAILGLILALSSIMILGTINTGLTSVTLPDHVEDSGSFDDAAALQQAIDTYCGCLEVAKDPTHCTDPSMLDAGATGVACGPGSAAGCSEVGEICFHPPTTYQIGDQTIETKGSNGICTLSNVDSNSTDAQNGVCECS